MRFLLIAFVALTSMGVGPTRIGDQIIEDNLGLGIAPIRNLHVHGGATTPVFKLSTDATGTATTDGFEIFYSDSSGVTITNRETFGDDRDQVKIHTRNIERMAVETSGEVTFTTGITIPACTGNANVCSGTWTPTATGLAGCGSYTGALSTFQRVGDIVSVAGRVDCGTPSGDINLRISLPIASDFVNALDGNGNFVCRFNGLTADGDGFIQGDIANDELIFFHDTDIGGGTLFCFFTAQYIIK